MVPKTPKMAQDITPRWAGVYGSFFWPGPLEVTQPGHTLCVKKMESVSTVACFSQSNSQEFVASSETTQVLLLAMAQPLYPTCHHRKEELGSTLGLRRESRPKIDRKTTPKNHPQYPR